MMKRHILCIATVLLAVSCTADLEEGMFHADGYPQLHFGASRCNIITRGGDDAERFADGTKYDLYALDATSSPLNWSKTGMYPALLSNDEGVEDYDADEIVYNGMNHVPYNERTVDIYAVTLGSTVNPGSGTGNVDYTPAISTSGPKYGLQVLSAESDLPGIPDLMRVKQTGLRGSGGKVTLEFKHTLSKLTFEVVKQNESGDDGVLHKLDNIYVASIRLKGNRTKGTLDLASGNWEALSGGDTSADDRAFFTMGLSQWEVPHTQAQLITTGNGNVNGAGAREIYIFPNTDSDGKYLAGEQSKLLSVEVTLRKTTDLAYTKTVTYALHDVEANGTVTDSAFRFKPNFEYRLTITILRDDVRIVTVSPRVYDWIPAFPGGDMDVKTLGHPITFGGLMWMDRNLGAETYDCKTLGTWYKSIGYFYQHGRNIPYILDTERWLDPNNFSNLSYYDNNQNNLSQGRNMAVMSMRYVEENGNERNPYLTSLQNGQFWAFKGDLATDPQIFYTYNYIGEKIYGSVKYKGSNKPPVVPVRFPGQRPQQWSGAVLTDASAANYDKAYMLAVADLEGGVNTWYAPITDINSNWADVDDQPCPKGWRLPTTEDLKTFMPYIDGKKIDWNADANKWGTLPYTDKYKPYIRFGWLNIWHEGKMMKIHRCRHIINLGKSNASRIQIESRPVAGCTNKRYIHVARYPITDVNKNMYYYMDPDGDGTFDDALWQDKDIVEEMYFPASGGIVTDGGPYYPVWRWLGEGTVLRTSENDFIGDMASVCYMASSDLELQIGTTSRRVLACQIRCVRDVK